MHRCISMEKEQRYRDKVLVYMVATLPQNPRGAMATRSRSSFALGCVAGTAVCPHTSVTIPVYTPTAPSTRYHSLCIAHAFLSWWMLCVRST